MAFRLTTGASKGKVRVHIQTGAKLIFSQPEYSRQSDHAQNDLKQDKNPARGNGPYLMPKTFWERRLRRLGCGMPWKIMRRESFSSSLSWRRRVR